MDSLTQIIVWLNAAANSLGRLLRAPVEWLPGWISATIVAAVTGIALLLIFKYTSNQLAIKRVRADIKANMLALKLFKESASVALEAQGHILYGAFWLLIYAIVQILVMMVPVLLILGQLALWYQARPLRAGEEALVMLRLAGDSDSALSEVRMQPTGAVSVEAGPVRVRSKGEVWWRVRAQTNGYHHLAFQVGEQSYDKELAVGNGIMRVSMQRPGRQLSDLLMHPSEQPFDRGSPVQCVEITYPSRKSWTSGTDYWVIYWFVASMVAALIVRRPLNVNI